MLSFAPMKTLFYTQTLQKISKQNRLNFLLFEDTEFSKKLQPEIVEELKSQIKNGKLPSTFDNITKISFETQLTGSIVGQISKSLSYLKNYEPAKSKSSTLNAILISEENQFILFMALDENLTKNRVWETSIKIKKNPTTKM